MYCIVLTFSHTVKNISRLSAGRGSIDVSDYRNMWRLSLLLCSNRGSNPLMSRPPVKPTDWMLEVQTIPPLLRGLNMSANAKQWPQKRSVSFLFWTNWSTWSRQNCQVSKCQSIPLKYFAGNLLLPYWGNCLNKFLFPGGIKTWWSSLKSRVSSNIGDSYRSVCNQLLTKPSNWCNIPHESHAWEINKCT